mgnify:CR=1 FL=1
MCRYMWGVKLGDTETHWAGCTKSRAGSFPLRCSSSAKAAASCKVAIWNSQQTVRLQLQILRSVHLDQIQIQPGLANVTRSQPARREVVCGCWEEDSRQST